MVERNCAKTIAKAYKDFPHDEVEALVGEIKARLAHGQQPSDILPKLLRDLEQEQAIKRRNAAFNALRYAEMRQYVANFRRGHAGDAVISLLVGREGVGSRSAAAIGESKAAEWHSTLMYRLEKLGDTALASFLKGDDARDIYRAMYAIRRGERADVPAYVHDTAQVLVDHQRAIVGQLNKAGAFIDELDDWIHRAYHDPALIAPRRGESREDAFSRWWSYVSERLDYQRSFGMTREEIDADPDMGAAFMADMRRIWEDLRTGTHFKLQGDATGRGVGTGGGNIARRASAGRKLHWRDADAFYEYQKEFGNANLMNVMERHTYLAAKQFGILRTLGPNYEMNLNRLVSDLGATLQGEAKDNLVQNLERIDRYVKEIDGSLDSPADNFLAVAGTTTRALIGWSKLGKAMLSMLSDSAIITNHITSKGGSLLKAYGRYFKELGVALKKHPDRDVFLANFGVATDMFRTSWDEFGSQNPRPGRIERWVTDINKFYGRATMMTQGTAAAKRAAMFQHIDLLGRLALAGRSMADMNTMVRDELFVAGIRDAEWDAIRTGAGKQSFEGWDEVAYVRPGDMQNLDDAVVDRYLEAKGLTSSDAARGKARDDLEDLLRAYYYDIAKSSVVEAKAELKGKMRGGRRTGTFSGEAGGLFFQFKSFPLGVLFQHVWRNMRIGLDRPATKMDVLKEYRAWGPRTAAFFLQTVALGYASMSLKDLASNRTPRVPTDVADGVKIFLAAAAQGGGAGIFGDFLFGQVKNRMGGGPVSTLVGPWASPFGDIADLWARALNGDDTASAGVRALLNNAPFGNLFYIRPFFDYFLMNEVSETLNPGSVQRSIRRMENETGQRPLFTP